MRIPRASTPAFVKAFFALAFVVYVGVFPYVGVVNNPNENVRTFMTMALVEGHTFKIDAIVERHGWTNDMARAPDKKTGAFHLYSVKAPAVSYAGVPVYWAFTKIMPLLGRPIPTRDSPPEMKARWLADATWALRVFSVQIPCFLFLIFFERALRRVSEDAILRLTAVAAVGLGSNYLAYALMFASHALFAVAAFVSFFVTLRAREKKPRERTMTEAFVAGFCAGWATLLEYHALPVSACLALFALITFYRPTRFVAMSFGGLLHVAGMAFFQWRAFGDPMMPGHRMSENQQFAHLLNQGYFGIQTPDFQHAKLLLFSRSFGLFGTSPYLWLGLFAIPLAFVSGFGGPKARSVRRLGTFVWVVTCGVLLLTVSAAINWRGGWTVGPRYLGAIPPFLAYGAICAAERLAGPRRRRTGIRALFGGAALASVAQTGVVSLVCNSIPENVGRPLPQLAIPLLRGGFVPRHLGDLVGFSSTTFGYVVVGCLLLAAFVPFLATAKRERRLTKVVRAGIGLVTCAVMLVPAMREAEPDEASDGGVNARSFYASIWEPAGRDRLAKAKERAERTNDPCAYARLARLEEMMSLEARASASRARANGARCE